jgi:hypothetical protein
VNNVSIEILGFDIFATDKASAPLRGVAKTAKETAVAVELTQVRIAKATLRLSEAQKKYGKDSLQAREASARLAQAQVQLERQTKKTTSATASSGEGFSKFKAAAVTGAGIVGAVLFKLGKDAVASASDVAESQSKNQVVFGRSASAVQRLADTSAKSFGISKAAALEAAGTFGNLFVSLKLPQEQASKMSVKLIQLASDMASFNNADPSEVLEALRSGLVGETEPLRKFGVNIQDATLQQEALKLGLVTTTTAVLPPAIKAQAAYALILDQTKTAQGDFARTSQGNANQQRILTAQLEDQKAKLGAKILPLWLDVAHTMNNVVLPAVTALASGLGMLPATVKLLGATFVGVSAAAVGFAYVIKAVASAVKAVQDASELTGLSKFAKYLANPWVAAVLLGTATIGYFALRHHQAAERVRDLTATLDENTGSITKNTREMVVQRLQSQGAIEQAQKLGLNLQDVTQAALGNAEALGRLDRANHEHLLSLQAQHEALAPTAFAYLDLRKAITGTSGEIDKAVRSAKAQVAVQKATSGAVQQSGLAASTLAYWQGQVAHQADLQTAAEKRLSEALDATRNQTLLLRGGEDAYWASLQAVKDALKENGRTLDVHSVKGRANRQALDDEARASLSYLQTLKDQNAPAAQFNARLDEARTRLIISARHFGATNAEAKRYADQVLGVPHQVSTRVLTPGLDGARKSVQALRGDIQAINGRTVKISVNADGSLTRRLFDAAGRQTGSATMRAAGGIIPGPPSTTDTVPAWLSTGEFVVNAKATQRHRSLLEQINAAGYAGGGLIRVQGAAHIPRGYASLTNRILDDAMLAAVLPPAGGGTTGGTGGNAANIALGQVLAAARGWTGSLWSALRALWTGESGWNNLAKNPTSSAFGIPQFLAGTARQYGVLGVTDPVRQILAGEQYIADVYGNPSVAYSRWLGRSPHWYDQGGWLQPGMTLAYNGTGRAERVIGPRQSGGDTHIHVHVENRGVIGTSTDVEDLFTKVLDRLRRTGRLPKAA